MRNGFSLFIFLKEDEMSKGIFSTVIGIVIGGLIGYVYGLNAREVKQLDEDLEWLHLETEKLKENSQSSEQFHKSFYGCPTIPKEIPQPPKKIGRLKMLLGLRKAAKHKSTVIGELASNPDDLKIEAYVVGDGVRIDLKRRGIPIPR